MATWLSRAHAHHIGIIAGPAPVQAKGIAWRRLELLAVCRRAWAAADRYEGLAALSDRALADRGLTRSQLARVAWREVSD